MKKGVILLVFGILISISLVSFVYACSCAMYGTPEEELEGATAVFSGKVIKIETPGQMVLGGNNNVTFDIIEIWKGDAWGQIIIKTSSADSLCGFGFAEGKEYLVYAFGDISDLQTNICQRTKLLSEADEDLEYLKTLESKKINDQECAGSGACNQRPVEQPVCGDGVCEGNESGFGCDPPPEGPNICEGHIFCPEDCEDGKDAPPKDYCGNGICDEYEEVSCPPCNENACPTSACTVCPEDCEDGKDNGIPERKQCDAEWEGYIFNPELKECVLVSSTGCENPFKYLTKQECEKDNKSTITLSNGRNAEVKIMPETASERAIERLGELNFTIELKEVGKGDDVKIVYELTGNKNGRFLGIFKIQAKIQAQVDAETGEVIKVEKPWWAFLATNI
jgi:hypothetical protein